MRSLVICIFLYDCESWTSTAELNFFDSMVNRIYPSELQLNKANVSDAEASFFGFTLIYIGWFCED